MHNGKYSQQNYGSEDKLYIKTGNTNYYRKAFLKFDLSLVKAPIKSAKLRLYGYNSKTNNDTVVKIYRVEDNDWQEDTITWSNAPSTAAYIGDIIVDATPRYHEIDVTGYISECISGDGFVSFGLIPTIVDNVYFNSKEADENNPELLIEY